MHPIYDKIYGAISKALTETLSYPKNVYRIDDDVIALHRYYSEPGVRSLCHRVKDGDMGAAAVMAGEFREFLSDRPDAVLVPVPSHEGYATYTREIAMMTGLRYADCLRCGKRIPLYLLKKQGIGVTENDLDMYVSGRIPGHGDIYLIDNVYASGLTARAAMRLLPGAGMLVYAFDETVVNQKK